MVDKYGTEEDPDCYPGTSTLINLLNITDNKTLESAERDITEACVAELEFQTPPYNLDYLCTIHKQIFQDIYPWAGQLRQLDISRGSTHFCNVNFINRESEKLFVKFSEQHYFEGLKRESLIPLVAEFYGDLNMIHPFREGNGRTQRILFEHIIINAGFEIFWEPVNHEQWVKANIAAVTCDYTPLETIFGLCIGNPLD